MSDSIRNHPDSEGCHDPDTELLFYDICEKSIGELAVSSEWYFTAPKPGFDPAPRSVRPELRPGFKPSASAYDFPEPRIQD